MAWLAVNSGKLHVSGAVLEREMAVFAESNQAIDLVAKGAVEFVIGSARRHPYPLMLGPYSVHTSESALASGERNIAELERGQAVAAIRNLN